MLLKAAFSLGVSNNLIANFGSCLLHIINYQLLDLQPVPYPWILSRYIVRKDTRGRALEFFYKDVNLPLESVRNLGYSVYYVGREKYERKPKFSGRNLGPNLKWYCLAQFYLYPPSDREASNLLQWYGLAVPQIFRDLSPKRPYYDISKFLSSSFDGYSDLFQGKNKIPELEITSRTAYRFLISDKKTEFASWVYWNLGIRPFISRYPATYLFNIVTHATSGNFSEIFLVCFYCSPHKLTRVRSDIKTITNKTLLTAMLKYLFLTQNLVQIEQANVKIIEGGNYVYKTFDVLQSSTLFDSKNENHIDSKHKVGISILYQELLQTLFSNVSSPESDLNGLIGRENCGGFPFFQSAHDIVNANGSIEVCQRLTLKTDVRSMRYVQPSVEFNKLDDSAMFEDISMLLGENPVTFMTCTQMETHTISFTGFFSAFDKATWVCILFGKNF